VGVGVALEHGQVGLAEVAGERGGGQQLADQVFDALLVLRAGLGEPVGGAHAPVQRGALGVGQLQRAQPGRVDQGQAGQGVGVDPIEGVRDARSGEARADGVRPAAQGRVQVRGTLPQ